MSQFDFTPQKSYEGLLKQANAMTMLIRSMEKQKSFQNVKIGDMARELALQGYEEINALRGTNELLTNECDSLERERDTYRELCGELLTHLKNSYQKPSVARDYLLESSITKAEKLLGEKK